MSEPTDAGGPENEAGACPGCDADRRAFVGRAAFVLVAALGLTRVAPLAARASDRGEVVYPVPAADGVEIDRENEVILARAGGTVYAFSLSCPHQRQLLRWQEREQRFQCPKHKSRYQPDGTFISGRATRAMDRHPIRRDGDTVRVDVATKIRRDREPQRWETAAVRVA